MSTLTLNSKPRPSHHIHAFALIKKRNHPPISPAPPPLWPDHDLLSYYVQQSCLLAVPPAGSSGRRKTESAIVWSSTCGSLLLCNTTCPNHAPFFDNTARKLPHLPRSLAPFLTHTHYPHSSSFLFSFFHLFFHLLLIRVPHALDQTHHRAASQRRTTPWRGIRKKKKKNSRQADHSWRKSALRAYHTIGVLSDSRSTPDSKRARFGHAPKKKDVRRRHPTLIKQSPCTHPTQMTE